MKNRDIELLNTMARGIIIVRADDDNDVLSVNEHIENEKKIKTLTLAEKHEYMKKFLLNGIGQNTFEVSYTGRVPFSGLDKYICDFIPRIDMRLSGGISIEIFTVGENFCINIMQRNDDSRYTDRFAAILTENGINCVQEPPEYFEINDFILPE